MIKITPLRRTIRHLAQRLRMEGETFINSISLLTVVLRTAKGLIILVVLQSVYTTLHCASGSQDSQDEGISFGDGNCMLKMRRQRPVSRDNSPLIG